MNLPVAQSYFWIFRCYEHLYKRVCLFIHPSISPSVCVGQSVDWLVGRTVSLLVRRSFSFLVILKCLAAQHGWYWLLFHKFSWKKSYFGVQNLRKRWGNIVGLVMRRWHFAFWNDNEKKAFTSLFIIYKFYIILVIIVVVFTALWTSKLSLLSSTL